METYKMTFLSVKSYDEWNRKNKYNPDNDIVEVGNTVDREGKVIMEYIILKRK